ncbi:biliverdin-producing heme oxygenase [Pseudonocardia sp. HH130630-07]|uniref:biliverdin-producing heme oxygenase n=1 Tax=Pseudonocardia sp. HH130630-07 TaxID=1690815 RepID=UPI00081523E4|nr:biliverdin-producing heme oxygenase [Pseudonocardia sp. HH130630-07]ANY04987.1 heme oxygenase [Pseudonocardia sp. HH130630-07]
MGATTPISGTSPASPEPAALSAELRATVHEVHERAHHSVYMAALLDGALPLAAYTLLAEQYGAIYGALEAASDTLAEDPVAGPFVIDELRRLPALHADLDALGSGIPRILPSTATYVARLREAAGDPVLYVAHHYTRYLGDLAGGQIVGRLLSRTYGIDGAGGLFYDFSALGSPSRFRTRYRELLDTAGWSEADRARLKAEAVHAFELNIAVLAEMAEEVGLEQPLAS